MAGSGKPTVNLDPEPRGDGPARASSDATIERNPVGTPVPAPVPAPAPIATPVVVNIELVPLNAEPVQNPASAPAPAPVNAAPVQNPVPAPEPVPPAVAVTATDDTSAVSVPAAEQEADREQLWQTFVREARSLYPGDASVHVVPTLAAAEAEVQAAAEAEVRERYGSGPDDAPDPRRAEAMFAAQARGWARILRELGVDLPPDPAAVPRIVVQASDEGDPAGASTSGASPGAPHASQAAVDWGRSLDGTIGLVQIDPYPEETLRALRAQLAAAVRQMAGVPGDAAYVTGDELARQFDSKFVNSWLKEEEPHVRDEDGALFTVEYGGTRYAIEVRATFVDPELARDLPAHDPAVPAQRPMIKQEERVTGIAWSQRPASTSNYRSLPWFLLHGWAPGSATMTVQPVITHNQLTTSSLAGDGVIATVVMRTRQNSVPYDFALHWQYRIGEATADGSVPDGVAWQNANTPGETRAFIPDHLAIPKPVGDLRPASLDDIPLYSTDAVKHPSRALKEARRTLPGGLAGLSEASQATVRKFLGEKSVRGNVRLARAKAYVSDVLYDTKGRALGVLRLDLEVDDGNLAPRVPSEKIMMENYLGPITRLTGSTTVTNELGVRIPVSGTAGDGPGVAFTGTPVNVKRSARTTLGSGGTTVLFRSLKSAEPHLQVDAGARFTLTLVPPDGAEQELSSWDQGLVMRVQTTKTADGIPPRKLPDGYLSPDGVRYAPPEVADLRSLGMSATPHLTRQQVAAMEPFWASVEAELRQRGYLPGAEPEPEELAEPAEQTEEHSAVGNVLGNALAGARRWAAQALDWDARLRDARLRNYRTLALARSGVGQEAMAGDKPGGGHSLFFEKPGRLSNERLELRLSASSRGEPVYLKTVGGVQIINFSNTTLPGSESRTVSVSGTAEFGVTVEGTFPNDVTQGSVTPVGVNYTQAAGTTKNVTNGLQNEQALLSTTAHRMDVFSVPELVNGGLYHDDAETPVARFSAETSINLWLPEQRTSATPFPRAAQPRVPTARVLTKAERAQAEADIMSTAVPVPDTSIIDDIDTSALLQQALSDILAGRHDERTPSMLAPVREILRDFLAALGDRGSLLPTTEPPARPPGSESTARQGAATGWWRLVSQFAVGEDMASPASDAMRAGRIALSRSRLLPNGHQLLKSVIVAEHLSASGNVTDTDAMIELRGVLKNARLVRNPTYNAKNEPQNLAGGFPAYTEHDMYGPDGTSLAKQTVSSAQLFAAASLTPHKGSAGALTFGGQYAHRWQRSDTAVDGTNGQINRVDAEDDVMFRLVFDLGLMLDVKRGTRNIVVNALPGQFGVHEDVAVWIDVPDGVQNVWTGHQVRENLGALRLPQEQVEALLPILPQLGKDDLRLPEYVRAGDGLPALAAVTDIRSLNAQAAVADEPERQDAPVVHDRDHFLNGITTLIEQHTPGALTPGRQGYVPGLKSRLAEAAGPLGMRVLPGRKRQLLHYTYTNDAGASAWYELELTARIRPGTDLDTLYGHDLNGPKGDATAPAGENGVENYATASTNITAQTRTETRADTYSFSVTVEDSAPGTRDDKTALTGTLTASRDAAQSVQRIGDDRTALRSSVKGAQFHIPHVYGAALRKGDSDPTVFGMTNRLVSDLTDAMRDAIRRLRGVKPLDSRTSLQDVQVRFSSVDTPKVADSAPEIAPRLRAGRHARNPFTLTRTAPVRAPGSRVAEYTVPDSRIVTLHEDLQVTSYTGLDALHTALGEVAPELFKSGSRLWQSEENGTIHLAQILRRGGAQLGNTRGEFGLLSEPGDEPSVTVEPVISGLRVLNTGGVPIDRMNQSNTTVTGTADSTITPSLSVTQTVGDTGQVAGGATLTLMDRGRTVSGQSAVHTGIRREILKVEPNPERGDGTHGARADLTLKVIGPGGRTRYVTGTAYLRLTDQDVLGHGIVAPEPYPGTFDLRTLGKALATGDPEAEFEALAEYVRGRIARFEGDAQAKYEAALAVHEIKMDEYRAAEAEYQAAVARFHSSIVGGPLRATLPPKPAEPVAPTRASYPGTIHLWIDLREEEGVEDWEPISALFIGARLARMLNRVEPRGLAAGEAAPRQAAAGQAVRGRAVQVALRDDKGVRQVLFDPAGRLQTTDDAARTAMARLIDAAQQVMDAPESEWDALSEPIEALQEAALNAHAAIGLGPRANRLFTSYSGNDALWTPRGRHNPFREYAAVRRWLFPFSSRAADRLRRRPTVAAAARPAAPVIATPQAREESESVTGVAAQEAERVPVPVPVPVAPPEPPAEVPAMPATAVQEAEVVPPASPLASPPAREPESVPAEVAQEVERVPAPVAQPQRAEVPAVTEPAPAVEPAVAAEESRPPLAAVPRRPLPFAFHTTDVVIDLPTMVREAGPDSALARQLDALREMSRSPGRTAIDQEAIAQTAERIVDALVPRLLAVARGHTRLLFRFPTGDVIAASTANLAQTTADLLHRRVYLVLGESTILAELCPHGHA